MINDFFLMLDVSSIFVIGFIADIVMSLERRAIVSSGNNHLHLNPSLFPSSFVGFP